MPVYRDGPRSPHFAPVALSGLSPWADLAAGVVDFYHRAAHPCTYISGETTIDLPLGKVYVEISKGFEVRPVRQVIEVTPATHEITIEVEKVLPWRERGWVTADTHVHFLSPISALLEGAAEGVNVVNLLASQWGELMTNVGDFDGKTTWGSREAGGDGEYLVRVGTENRQHVLGLDRWLRGEPERPLPSWSDAAFTLDPPNELQCWPRQDVHMRALTAARARELEAARAAARRSPTSVRQAARRLVGLSSTVPQAVVSEPFPVWTHLWQSLLLRPEPGIELPATFLYPTRGAAPALLYLDDRGRHAALYRQGPLARAIGFLERDRPGLAALAVDLRGWGDSAPAMYPYEMAGWGGLDRYVAYASAALGDPVMAMRARDALAALAYLRTRPEVGAQRIIVCGRGVGGIIALHVAACDERVAGVIVWEGLSSFRSLLEAETYAWPADIFWPGVLLYYDLPELAEALACPVRVLGPRAGAGNPLAEAELARLNRRAMVVYCQDSDAAALAEAVAVLTA